jgi:hypothetical protein
MSKTEDIYQKALRVYTNKYVYNLSKANDEKTLFNSNEVKCDLVFYAQTLQNIDEECQAKNPHWSHPRQNIRHQRMKMN